jgi:Uma2 family endonuclease
MDAVLERARTQPLIESSKKNDEPKTIRWSRDEYYRMAELGFFEGKRVELIKGEIIEMSPMKSAHATAISLADEVLGKLFSKSFVIRTQLPITFGKNDEPEPDVAVVEGKVRDFSESHPKTAALIIEVSETTLNYDRTRKASLYAENKIEDYWILNLKNRCLEVYRRPIKDKKLGFIYTEILVVTENETVSPLAKPAAKIKIADILP